MDHKGLQAFLFGIHIGDKAGLAEFDCAKDDSAGGVDHLGENKAKAEAEAKYPKKKAGCPALYHFYQLYA